MSINICNNPNHIHSSLVPPSASCRNYNKFNNYIAYSPRPYPIKFEKFNFEKITVQQIKEEN